jgi:hypothetical protein
MTGPPRVRRNIDDLSSDELANYQHALKKLQEISQSDPESVDGYTYLEQMHDGDKGPCEHANDTFMPWHRGHLYLFEGALRRSDPPRTENVTVPYWDWSGLPSGERYPKAFEDSSSILFNFRNDDPICRPDMTGNCTTWRTRSSPSRTGQALWQRIRCSASRASRGGSPIAAHRSGWGSVRWNNPGTTSCTAST